MDIMYAVGLALALVIGGAIGLFLTVAHYERIASQHRAYEKEVAEGRDFTAALAMLGHLKAVNPMGDETSVA